MRLEDLSIDHDLKLADLNKDHVQEHQADGMGLPAPNNGHELMEDHDL